MSQKEIEAIYESLLQSDDLFDMFPGMTGEWKIDKDEFSKQYKINSDYLNDFDLEEDDLYTDNLDF